MPALGNYDVVHVRVGKHHPREGPPGPAQVQSPGAGHLAVDEREPRVLQ